MKTISVSARAKTLKELLKKARRGAIVLESADGQRFVLTAVHNREGFDVGNSETNAMLRNCRRGVAAGRRAA